MKCLDWRWELQIEIDCWTLKYLNKIKFEAPSNDNYFFKILDGRNPASPATEKKQKQCLKMSQDTKDA